MAKGRKRGKGETFETEVRRQFGPVADRLGLVDTEITDRLAAFGGVQYVRDGLRYWWDQDPREGDMWVHVFLDRDGDRFSTSVDDLVVGAGLGTGRDIECNSRTWLVLQRAVASHTTWIERLHPRLIGPDAHYFILDSGGRTSMPDAATYRRGREQLRPEALLSSAAGLIASLLDGGAYNASKQALEGLDEALTGEVAQSAQALLTLVDLDNPPLRIVIQTSMS